MPLQRTMNNRVISGVCGGIAQSLKWDPTLVRIAYFLVTLFTGVLIGTVTYIVLWIITPKSAG
jgi:phage shock protein C